jgi:hypothetical protein
MSIHKIHSVRTQIFIIAAVTLVVAGLCGNFFPELFTEKFGTDLTIAKLNVFGLTLSYLSVIVAAYALIARSSYDKRIAELENEDKYSSLKKQKSVMDACTQEKIDATKKEFEAEQVKIYEECHHYFAFDATARSHVYLSIMLVAIGGVFQIQAALL